MPQKKTQPKKKAKRSATETFELAIQKPVEGRYTLRLYVTGTNPISKRAILNIKRICEEYLAGRYDLEVIDIYQRPALAKGEQIIAAPTLVKVLPEPLRKFIGDLSDEARVLFGLDVRPNQKASTKKE